jgi:hypothetical protein
MQRRAPNKGLNPILTQAGFLEMWNTGGALAPELGRQNKCRSYGEVTKL